MIAATIERIPGREIVEVLGVARGNTIRARNVGRDLLASLKNIVGGEIHDYTKLMGEAREQALDRMIAHAKEMGADAVVGLRFSTAEVMNMAAEIVAYGTAVKLR